MKAQKKYRKEMCCCSLQRRLKKAFYENPYPQGKRAFKPGLERISALLTKVDNPQDSLEIIHVGGTNGKGTVVHHLASVFQEAGYKVGLFTSPKASG